MEATAGREILTERLRLRLFTAADLDAVCGLFGDPEVMRFIGKGKVRTREENATVLAAWMQHWQDHGFGPWAVEERAGGRFVGRCGIRRLAGTPEVELLYTYNKEFWGRGYGTEAAAASLRYGFETVGLPRIVAVADPANRGSTRVMEKVGMRFEKTAPFQGEDSLWYALSREEYTAARRPASKA
jgi:ribosomal-protein-alanine N-acetyltransferase